MTGDRLVWILSDIESLELHKTSIQVNSTLHWLSHFKVMAVMLGKRIVEMKTSWPTYWGRLRKRRRDSRQNDERNDKNCRERGSWSISNGLLLTINAPGVQILAVTETNYRDGFKARNSINLPQFARLLGSSFGSLIRIIFSLVSPALRSFTKSLTRCRGHEEEIVSELDASIS